MTTKKELIRGNRNTFGFEALGFGEESSDCFGDVGNLFTCMNPALGVYISL